MKRFLSIALGVLLATQDGVYQKYCAHCHGEDGHGDGRFWTSDLSPKPSDLTATTLDQEALVGFITDGSSASGRSALCPPWGNTISSQNVERLSWYILAMQGEPSVAAPGLPRPSAIPARLLPCHGFLQFLWKFSPSECWENA